MSQVRQGYCGRCLVPKVTHAAEAQLDQSGTPAQEKDTPQKDQEPEKTERSHDLIQGTTYPRTAGLCLPSIRHFILAPEGAPIFQNSLS